MSEWLIEGASVVPLEDVIVCGDDYWHDPSVKRLRCPVCHDTYQHTMRTPKPIDAEDNYQVGWGGRSDLLLIPVEGCVDTSGRYAWASTKARRSRPCASVHSEARNTG
jgi:hypothetical protein